MSADRKFIEGTPSVWVLLRPRSREYIEHIEELWDGTYGLSYLSEKTGDHLQMSLQRQHFLLSYLKTLSVGPAGVLNPRPPAQKPDTQPIEQLVGIRDIWGLFLEGSWELFGPEKPVVKLQSACFEKLIF